MHAASLGFVSPHLGQSTSTAHRLVLVVVSIVSVLFALLICLYIWRQICCRFVAAEKQNALFALEKAASSPAALTDLYRGTTAHNAPTVDTTVLTKSYFQPDSVSQPTAGRTFSIYRGTDILDAVYLPPIRVEGSYQTHGSADSPTNCQSPPNLNRECAGRSSAGLTISWPQLYLPTQDKRSSSLGQTWRNSSGGSSYYSRPSSWYSVSDARGPWGTGQTR